MAKNGNATSRNQRNNPYVFEGWAVDFHRSKAGIAWRWRTELTLTAALPPRTSGSPVAITALWALIILAALVAAAAGHPAPAPVHQAAGLVPDLPAPPPAGLLRRPPAHPRRAGSR